MHELRYVVVYSNVFVYLLGRARYIHVWSFVCFYKPLVSDGTLGKQTLSKIDCSRQFSNRMLSNSEKERKLIITRENLTGVLSNPR